MARWACGVLLGVLSAVLIVVPLQSQVAPSVIGFVTVEKWRILDSRLQVAYVMGASDALSMVSTHIGNEEKVRMLRAFGSCLTKMGKQVKVERIHSLTRNLVEAAPSKFGVPKASVEKSVVAGWVELAVVDACP